MLTPQAARCSGVVGVDSTIRRPSRRYTAMSVLPSPSACQCGDTVLALGLRVGGEGADSASSAVEGDTA